MVDAVLVGCGAMSKAWLDAAKRVEGLAIVGLVDVDPARAESRAAEFGLTGAATGADVGAVLDRTKPAIVFDVVPPQARRAVAEAAFAHGCHLLTEKPLAGTPDDARAILAGARKAGRLHAVVQNRRYLAGVRRIRRFLNSGAIGAPTSLHCDFFLAPHFGGFREEMDHVLLLDMAIHTFDAARALSGRDPRRVVCLEWEPKNSWYRQGSSAAAIFEMEGGVPFVYRGSWCADGARTSWESSWRIVCERGTLLWDGFDALHAEVVAPGERDGLFSRTGTVEIPPLDPRDRVGGHLGVIEDFLSAVKGGPPPETAGADNARSLAMVFAAIDSATTGRRIDVETAWGSA